MNNSNRRNFIKKTTIVGLGVGLAGGASAFYKEIKKGKE